MTNSLPSIPLLCLETADDVNALELVQQSKWTVIDFWTTRCVRCPAALDHLNELEYPNAQFLSFCCDIGVDRAREVVEDKWKNLRHFGVLDKERAKELLGFSQVPFYVLVNENGEIVYKGHQSSAWEEIVSVDAKEEKENTSDEAVAASKLEQAAPVEREFVLEDLDF